ncbi:MAG: DUF89 family protein [Clostridia bacterium]|nr:DUF89 family protein [Clostridia bacterium]
MQTQTSCLPCLVRIAREAIAYAVKDETRHRPILNKVLHLLAHSPETLTPAETFRLVQELIAKETGCPDPYRDEKIKCNLEAQALYPLLTDMVARDPHPLLAATKLAISGNIMDYGASREFDVHQAIHQVNSDQLTIDHFAEFQASLGSAKLILYIGDNAGETFFDRILLEQIVNRFAARVIYVVKGGPAINDALLEDALFAGINEIAPIITTGRNATGADLDLCSLEFREAFYSADMVIAKGQGNWESLHEVDHNVFFLIKVKCQVIGDLIGVPQGSAVLVNALLGRT